MKSKIFNTDQIRAIQDGRMTQFMQVVKPQPYPEPNIIRYQPSIDKQRPWIAIKNYVNKYNMPYGEISNQWNCPLGKIGDVIYVRETTRKYYNTDGDGNPVYSLPIIEYAADNPEPLYMQDGDGFQVYNKDGSERFVPWISSATMPREAARLFLRITNIRVMRAQELTDQNAMAQGYRARTIKQQSWCAIDFLKTEWPDKYYWIIDFEKTNKP